MNETRKARIFRLVGTKNGSAACLVMALLALAGLSGARGMSANEVAAAPRQRLLVLPFDLYDYSLDRRPVTVVPLRRWARRPAGRGPAPGFFVSLSGQHECGGRASQSDRRTIAIRQSAAPA